MEYCSPPRGLFMWSLGILSPSKTIVCEVQEYCSQKIIYVRSGNTVHLQKDCLCEVQEYSPPPRGLFVWGLGILSLSKTISRIPDERKSFSSALKLSSRVSENVRDKRTFCCLSSDTIEFCGIDSAIETNRQLKPPTKNTTKRTFGKEDRLTKYVWLYIWLVVLTVLTEFRKSQM